MKRFSLILIAILIPLGFTYGQSPDDKLTPVWGYDPTQEFVMPSTLFWSPDSSVLYFDVLDTDQHLKRYDVATGTLEDTSGAPQTIELSPEQQNHFHAQNSVGYIAPDQDTFAYISTYQTYSTAEGGYTPYLYAVGSLKDQTFEPTRVPVIGGGHIRWSDDSSAFVLEYGTPYGGQVGVFYVKGTGAECQWHFCTLAETLLTSLDLGETIYDLSPSGERILYPDFSGVFRLWDVTKDAGFGEVKNQRTTLPIENITGGAFLPDTPDVILIVNTDGIMQYDLDTQDLTLINPHITSKWAKWVLFSPDNRYVAVFTGNDGGVGFRQLFVLPVSPNE